MSLSGKSTMEVKRLRTLALKAFKTLNNMNPEYMKEIFQNTKQYESRIHEGNISKGSLLYASRRSLNLELNENHSTKYGSKSRRYPGKSKMTGFSYLELPSK